jgi:hypothetical protein
MESLPPSLTAIRDEYVGLGKEFNELRMAFRAWFLFECGRKG